MIVNTGHHITDVVFITFFLKATLRFRGKSLSELRSRHNNNLYLKIPFSKRSEESEREPDASSVRSAHVACQCRELPHKAIHC